MGATGIYTKQSFEEVLRQEFHNCGYKILAKHYVKEEPLNGELEEGHYYCALKHPSGYVFGCVITMVRVNHNNREEVIYKMIDEGMGPCYYNCPEEVMNLLSPVNELPYPGYSLEWRNKQKVVKDKQMHKFTQ